MVYPGKKKVDVCNNRMNVDGHGRGTRRYTN
jgi:hypothetical protein